MKGRMVERYMSYVLEHYVAVGMTGFNIGDYAMREL